MQIPLSSRFRILYTLVIRLTLETKPPGLHLYPLESGCLLMLLGAEMIVKGESKQDFYYPHSQE